MAAKEQSLDWGWIHEKLQELDILKYASTYFGFIKLWFDIVIPASIILPDEVFFETATEAILHNGVFGFHNNDNRGNIKVNILRENKGHILPIIRNAAEALFPSYQVMRKNRIYSFIDGKPLLTPAAWIYRAGRKLIGVMKGKEEMPIIVPSKSKIITRDEFLNNWGL